MNVKFKSQKNIFLLMLCCVVKLGWSQQENEFGVQVMDRVEEYRVSVKTDEKYKLIDFSLTFGMPRQIIL